MALPIQELNTRIQEELEKNPALEILSEKPTVSLEEAENIEITKNDTFEYFENSSDPGFSTTSGRVDTEAADAKHKFIEGTLSRPESLQDNLIWQLRLQKISEREREIGELLIHNLDSNGFHSEEPEKLIEAAELEILQRMISLIRHLEPLGTCTSDYKESLLVQISLDKNAPDKLAELVENHMEQLEKNKTKEICRSMKIEEEQLQDLIVYLKRFTPFPGREYSTEEVKYVIPDLMVKLKEGEFVIILNDEEIPVLGLNSFFQELNKNQNEENKETSEFVKANIQEAKWFIRSIHQRNETLLKISSAILDLQRNFFI
jgi:RNA polymerase sigma-54 factor